MTGRSSGGRGVVTVITSEGTCAGAPAFELKDRGRTHAFGLIAVDLEPAARTRLEGILELGFVLEPDSEVVRCSVPGYGVTGQP